MTFGLVVRDPVEKKDKVVVFNTKNEAASFVRRKKLTIIALGPIVSKEQINDRP